MLALIVIPMTETSSGLLNVHENSLPVSGLQWKSRGIIMLLRKLLLVSKHETR